MERSGQSLVELMVGIALGALFIVGAATAIAPALQTNKQVVQVQTKTELANELLDNTRAWAAGNWNNVLSLATGTSNLYYLNITTSSFTVATGSQSVAVGSTTYTRSFYLSDVYRDGNGNVTTTAAGNSYDPSTKQVTVAVGSSTYTFYLTRNVNNGFSQTSWAGSPGQSSALTLATTSYWAVINTAVTAMGSIQLTVPSGGSCEF